MNLTDFFSIPIVDFIFQFHAVETLAERLELGRYSHGVERYFVLVVRQTCIQAVYFMVCNTFLINTCVQGAILLYGIKMIEDGTLGVNVLLAFMLYQGMLQEYCQNLFNSFTSLLKSSGAAAKVFEYIDRQPHYDRERTGVIPDAHTESSPRAAHIELRDVHFEYSKEDPVLRGVSFEARPGEVVALVGASGSGKSTCFHLLEHFYEPLMGSVMLDGLNVSELDHR